jgi:hypothetical protein
MKAGVSTKYGKVEITNFIKERFPISAEILDVGAGSGTYKYYLGKEYINIDAVELWPEAITGLKQNYRAVYQKDIREFQYTRRYNLIIFGDILEHLTVEDAQMVLCEAKKWGEHILIGVPYLYKQEPLYGNEAERHLQEDLTHEIFTLRYPEYEFIFGKFDFYGYYYR